jgi:hypothetical protein
MRRLRRYATGGGAEAMKRVLVLLVDDEAGRVEIVGDGGRLTNRFERRASLADAMAALGAELDSEARARHAAAAPFARPAARLPWSPAGRGPGA